MKHNAQTKSLLWLAITLFLTASTLVSAADITGTWEVTSDLQGNRSLNFLTLSKGQGVDVYVGSFFY